MVVGMGLEQLQNDVRLDEAPQRGVAEAYVAQQRQRAPENQVALGPELQPMCAECLRRDSGGGRCTATHLQVFDNFGDDDVQHDGFVVQPETLAQQRIQPRKTSATRQL